MEQPEYLIDTNAFIDYLGNKLTPEGFLFMDNIIDKIPHISVITKIEVLGFNAPAKDYELLISFMNDAHVFALSEAVVEESIAIRKQKSHQAT